MHRERGSAAFPAISLRTGLLVFYRPPLALWRRRDDERLGETGQCGKCQEAIAPPGSPVEVGTEAHFNRLVAASTLPVVVDYWAPWCGPCLRMAPELEKVATSGRGRFVVAKVNTQALPALAQRFNIRSIPTLGVFVGGREA